MGGYIYLSIFIMNTWADYTVSKYQSILGYRNQVCFKSLSVFVKGGLYLFGVFLLFKSKKAKERNLTKFLNVAVGQMEFSM